MIAKARDVKRYKQKKLSSLTRGIYSTPEEDLFDVYLYKYKTGVITLETALSFYDLIDEWIETPYCFSFQTGYRKIHDSNIRQFRDKKEIANLGVITLKRHNTTINIYSKERLLIELWRKEKYISRDIYKQAIYNYRNLANSGELNIPLIKQYLSIIPKSNIYKKRLSMEVL